MQGLSVVVTVGGESCSASATYVFWFKLTEDEEVGETGHIVSVADDGLSLPSTTLGSYHDSCRNRVVVKKRKPTTRWCMWVVGLQLAAKRELVGVCN